MFSPNLYLHHNLKLNIALHLKSRLKGGYLVLKAWGNEDQPKPPHFQGLHD